MTTLTTYDSTVNSFYLAFYGRPADPSGLKFWSKALADNNGDAGAIIQAFATSDEAQTRFGSDTVGARITDIYEQLFNRAPDADGLAFWTNAVEQGNATLAEVSLAILKGAQSSDLDLSTMRQKAADAFTAAVEDGSTEYSGYASIEAARVLVRAVTADATEADLAKLVKAAVSFADTATKTPKVVEAIATGSTLLNLYDSARGLKDPVALTQALADTAKAAAGDPVTLESLLRGGGMDKVLKVMPAKATLTDVVEALAKGGLPAAVEVVYPTAPTAPVVIPTPTPVPEKTFIVGYGEHSVVIKGTALDNVVVNLTKDSIERAGHDPVYSMNDIQTVSVKDYAGKVSLIGKAVEIAQAMSDAATNGVTGYSIVDRKSAIFTGEPGARSFVSHKMETLLASVTSVKLTDTLSLEERALFDGLQGFSSQKLFAMVDTEAPSVPVIALVNDDGASGNDGVTSVAKLAVSGLDKAADTVWQYSIDNGASWKQGGVSDNNGNAELDLSGMHAEATRVQVRQLDAAGNVSAASNAVVFTIVPGQEQPSDPNPPSDSDNPSQPTDPSDPSQPTDPTDPSDPNPPNDSDLPPNDSDLPPNDSDLPPIKALQITSVGYNLGAERSEIVLNTAQGPVSGLVSKGGMMLGGYIGGTLMPANNAYVNFATVSEETFQFGTNIKPNVYELTWSSENFTVGSGSNTQAVAGGSLLFAGGSGQYFKHNGFALDAIASIDSGTQRDGSDQASEAFYGGSGVSDIYTGGGHDAIMGRYNVMNITYDNFDPTASDLVFAFRPEIDTIYFDGPAAANIDRVRDGDITWSQVVNGVATVAAADEAVNVVVTKDIVAGDAAAMEITAATLRSYIDVSQSNQDLLILATNGSSAGALFHYSAQDENNQIDANELSMVAMFFNGVPTMDDIELVGVQQTLEA